MSTIGEKVRAAREARGWSQEKLAETSGVSQTTVDKIERGLTKRSRLLPLIARKLELDLHELDPELYQSPLPTTFESVRERVGPNHIVKHLTEEHVVPVYSADRIFERSKVTDKNQFYFHELGKELIDFVNRPSILLNSQDAYAVYISDGFMSPEIEPGDRIYIDPKVPAIESCTVLIRHESKTNISAIGRLISFDDDSWEIKQWKKSSTMKLKRSDWPMAHRVVAKYYRR